MREYYEALWERLPEDLEPEDLAVRRAFLLAHARPEDRALDLGCGDGRLTAELAAAVGTVTGADVAEAALRRARRAHPGITFTRVVFDGELPFEDGAFDLVWAGEVIEHVADTARWLSEVRRVLAPGGRLVLTTPNHGRLALAVRGVDHYAPVLGDHLHLYTPRVLGELLSEFAFGEISVTTAAGPPLLRRLLLASASR